MYYVSSPPPPPPHTHPPHPSPPTRSPAPTPTSARILCVFFIFFITFLSGGTVMLLRFCSPFNPRSLNPPGDGNLRSSANCASVQESGGPLHHKRSNTGPRLNQCSYITYQRCFQPKASFRGSISVSTLIIIVLGVICLVPIAFASRAN